MNKTAFTAAMALALGLSVYAVTTDAHGGNVPEHGGVLKMVADTSVELVARPASVEVWVEDGGEEIASSGMTCKLTIVQGGATTTAELLPAGGNEFEAKGLKIGHGAKVTVVVAAKEGHAKTAADFTVK